jgi:ABC-type polysaccharide/polyol phosphate export permease
MKVKKKANLLSYRDLLSELVKREIKARYKQSILGYAWVILVPLINLVVLSIVFSFLIRLPTGGIPYPIFLFTALVPWTFTANAISSATKSLSANSSLITKVYLPREIFPLSAIISKMVDLLLAVLILVLFLVYYKVSISLMVIFVPLIFLFHLMIVLGVSFILSAINVFFRDVQNVLGVFLTVWMYLTPVLYPPEIIPDRFVAVFNINPMTPIVNAYRNTVLHGVAPPMPSFAYSAVVSIVLFIFGFWFFKKRARYFADVV